MNTVLEQRVEQRTADLLIAKDKAETANKTKSTFLSNMSHELRTPLNAILGYAQIMQRDNNLDARQLANLQTINDSGDHLLTLITDLLDLAKIEAGKSALHLSPVMLRDFLAGVMAMLRMHAEQKGLATVCDLAPGLPPLVLMDEKRVRQVLLNLLNNAVKFTERGQITLRVSHLSSRVINGAHQACLRFKIEDSGIGIHADQLEIIFQPFEQVGEQKNQSSGTGLGLSISTQLIGLMNSKIYVDSTPGKGSAFWFDLVLGMPEFESTADNRFKDNCLPVTPSRPDNNLATLIPPPAEIDHLYQLALAGNMQKITQYAAQLLAADCRYRLFIDQLNVLAREYQTKALLKLIEARMRGSA